ncbi:mitochondrial carrier domain-containing protein [Pavlovales sp. CCMP2436]|nr:mitochondrial carrier domain-containing protein [Pavlovales sp. CCMP2436]
MVMDSKQQAMNVGLAGLGGVAAQFATHPCETTMVRQQLAGSLKEGGSMLSMASKIVRTEGIPMLWRGFEAAAIREVFYSSLRFGLYEPIKTALGADAVHYGGDAQKVPFWKKFTAGCLAGAIGSAIASPTDLLKTRMQRDTAMPPKGMMIFLRQVLAEPPGFPMNLYNGVGATITRAAVLGGTKMAVYDQDSTLASWRSGPALDLTRSSISSRLYAGFGAQWARFGPYAIIQFIAWEKLRALCGIPPI